MALSGYAWQYVSFSVESTTHRQRVRVGDSPLDGAGRALMTQRAL